MTLDEAIQGGERDPQKLFELVRPSKRSELLRVLEHLLGVFFPWMEPVDW